MNSFIQFALAHGLIIKSIQSNRWVRVPTTDHPHSKNGAYFHAGEYAHVQNWGTMDEAVTFFANKPTCPVEYAAMQKRMKSAQLADRLERIKLQQKAAEKAKFILSQCKLAHHPYMDYKGFKDSKVNVYYREDEPIMVVPMYISKRLCGIQEITKDGAKKFLFGQTTSNAYHHIGQGTQVYLTEGYASALSLHKILGALGKQAVVLATFSAGNMLKVSKLHKDCVLICDNDKSGVGEKVGKDSGRKWWMPPIIGWDINDLLVSKGLFQCTQILRNNV